MEGPRQEAFRKLRPPCVELHSVALRFRARQGNGDDVPQALNAVYRVLHSFEDKDGLDEKIAEYVFAPLSHIFNETQRLSLRSLEVAVNCLRILVERGWRHHLSPQMGKQLIILLTLIVGGTPAQMRGDQLSKPKSEELAVAIFKCLRALFDALEGPVAEQTIFNEIGTAAIIDQCVYILLEGIAEGSSDAVQTAAVTSSQALFTRITDRVVLASIMPRTVSALVKTLKPTTQKRRSFRVLQMCLQLLTDMLKTLLSDDLALPAQEKKSSHPKPSDRIVLDDSWLRATASQIRIALGSIVQLRRHGRPEIQKALLELCLMVVERCPKSLEESLIMMIETIVVLSELDADHVPNDAYYALEHLAITHAYVTDILKDLLHIWITSFSRVMQGNDEVAKQRAVRQVSTTFYLLSQVPSGSEILDSKMASGLCDSITAVVGLTKAAPNTLSLVGDSGLELSVLRQQAQLYQFQPLLFGHRSQQQTLKDLQFLITMFNVTDSAAAITRLIVHRIHHGSGDSLVAPLWLALAFLQHTPNPMSGLEDLTTLGDARSSSMSSARESILDEIYSVALPVLNEPPTTNRDWRISALALEAVALQARQLGEAFRVELIDALYPVLQFLASNNPSLQNHAITCLDILATACNYPDTSTMLIENVDYLVNAVALKLNTFDVSPYPPRVLIMMVKLCGAGLIPYLDDLVDSIFGILDMYHGYPKLVELLFSALGAIVEKGVDGSTKLAIANGSNIIDHRKRQYQPMVVSKLVAGLTERGAKRDLDFELPPNYDEKLSHPKRPWTTEHEEPPPPKDSVDSLPDAFELEDSNEPLPAPCEPEDSERPLSKSHALLLHITKSIPTHLTSPSPFLRQSLLSLLTQALPVLAQDENSCLPLINDLWSSVSHRIAFPPFFNIAIASAASTSGPQPLAINRGSERKVDDVEIKEEIFVIDTACITVATMCEYAGDFMASRVESEFPRWRNLYHYVWDKVRIDAEKVIERRDQRQRALPTVIDQFEREAKAKYQDITVLKGDPIGLDLTLGLGLTSSTSPATRIFTPHHALWRALVSLFISVLMHVRLPLTVGDEICELLGAWIARFASPEYLNARTGKTQKMPNVETKGGRQAARAASEEEAVEYAIQAMGAWNNDLTWFILQQYLTRMKRTGRTASRTTISISESSRRPVLPDAVRTALGENNQFVEMVF